MLGPDSSIHAAAAGRNANPDVVSNGQIAYATAICFLAWVFAVYDFILFGTLLPAIGTTFGWSATQQAGLATWISGGTMIVALTAGPVVDHFGRRAGVMFTVGGAALFSALTALAGLVGMVPLIIIRSFAGLGYAEQGVNGAYLSELYAAADSRRARERSGLIYAVVQGGWPVGALLAALLSALLLPVIGWRGVFLVAAIPSGLIAIAAFWLRESPGFEALVRARGARTSRPGAVQPARGHAASGFIAALSGKARGTTIVLTLTCVLGWMPVMIFSVLGTTVITKVHGISFENSLFILFLSNTVAFIGYLVHGFLGDRFGRRNVIAGGWAVSAVVYSAMLFGPHDLLTVIASYSIGNFFNIGPYSCLLFFIGQSFPAHLRGTGSAIVVGIGPLGGLLASFGAERLLGSGQSWLLAAFVLGAIPSLLAAVAVLCAQDIRSADTADSQFNLSLAQ